MTAAISAALLLATGTLGPATAQQASDEAPQIAAQPAAPAAAQPAAQPGAQPGAQPAAQPVAQPAAQPAAQFASQLASQLAAQLDAWRDHIRPCEAERAWERIGWHASFADGLRAADEAGRPLLLWMMNGHPLGCT